MTMLATTARMPLRNVADSLASRLKAAVNTMAHAEAKFLEIADAYLIVAPISSPPSALKYHSPNLWRQLHRLRAPIPRRTREDEQKRHEAQLQLPRPEALICLLGPLLQDLLKKHIREA